MSSEIQGIGWGSPQFFANAEKTRRENTPPINHRLSEMNQEQLC